MEINFSNNVKVEERKAKMEVARIWKKERGTVLGIGNKPINR